MSTTIRHYLFPNDGAPQRLSHRLTDGLVFGRDAMPQFAGTRQRVLSVWLNNEAGQPERIFHHEGTIWTFDAAGEISAGLQQSMSEFMEAAFSEKRSGPGGSTVIPLGPEISKRRLAAKYRWEAKPSDLDIIAADIWPNRTDAKLKAAKGTAPKPPPVSREARHALSEASQTFWKINYAIDNLKEPSLVGFIFAARDHGDPDYAPLYEALATIAEKRLEIIRRRRRDKGTWFAFVEVLRWDSERSGKTIATFHVECTSRSAAEVAARKLLAKHADKFATDVTVEAGIETDLEWISAARESVLEL